MNVWKHLGESPPIINQIFDFTYPEVKVACDQTALVIIDMDASSVRSDRGLIARARARGVEIDYYEDRLKVIIPNQRRLLDTFRQHGMKVTYTAGHLRPVPGGHKVGGISVRPLGLQGEDAASHTDVTDSQIIDELKPLDDELVIHKTTPGPFSVTNFDHALRMLNVKTLVIAGIVTHQCVEATVRGAFDHGYQVVLVEDGCATFSQDLHNASLRILGDWFCAVWSTDEVITALQTMDKKEGHNES